MCENFDCIYDIGGMCNYYSEEDYLGCEYCEVILEECDSCTSKEICGFCECYNKEMEA